MIITISVEANSAELKLISHALDFYAKHLLQQITGGKLDEYSLKTYGAQVAGANKLVKKINSTLYQTFANGEN